jgi:hypothetical protein
MDDTVSKLSINWLIIIPFTIHPVLQTPIAAKRRAAPVIVSSASYGDIVNYNTSSRASFFFDFFGPAVFIRSENRQSAPGPGSFCQFRAQ